MDYRYYFAKNVATGQRRIVNVPYRATIGVFVEKVRDEDFYVVDETCRFAPPNERHFRIQAETSEKMFNLAATMTLLGKESELWEFAEQMQAADAATAARQQVKPL